MAMALYDPDDRPAERPSRMRMLLRRLARSWLFLAFLVCFFPIVLNAILAFGSLPEELTRFIRATGASPIRAFLKVRWPAAMPQCFVGFKYAVINATVGAAIAEFIGSDQGLGFYIQIVTGNMRPDLAFGGIFLLTLLG